MSHTAKIPTPRWKNGKLAKRHPTNLQKRCVQRQMRFLRKSQDRRLVLRGKRVSFSNGCGRWLAVGSEWLASRAKPEVYLPKQEVAGMD